MQGVGSAEDIDRGMKLGTNQPMGPLQLADFIGGRTCSQFYQRLHFTLHGMSDYMHLQLQHDSKAAMDGPGHR